MSRKKGLCPYCHKKHIDLTSKMTFQAQKGKSDCNLTCKKIMRAMKIIPEGAEEKSLAFPKLGSKHESHYQLADESDLKKAYEYLDKALEFGHPVMVGVNHTFNYRSPDYINETTTDHYVVIVGRECNNGKIRYRFWDVGSKKGDEKEGEKWYFEKQENGSLVAFKTHNSKKYTVTQIRRNRYENSKDFIAY